jgi:hypothetical protein
MGLIPPLIDYILEARGLERPRLGGDAGCLPAGCLAACIFR